MILCLFRNAAVRCEIECIGWLHVVALLCPRRLLAGVERTCFRSAWRHRLQDRGGPVGRQTHRQHPRRHWTTHHLYGADSHVLSIPDSTNRWCRGTRWCSDDETLGTLVLKLGQSVMHTCGNGAWGGSVLCRLRVFFVCSRSPILWTVRFLMLSCISYRVYSLRMSFVYICFYDCDKNLPATRVLTPKSHPASVSFVPSLFQ